ncbi:hypothetical protein ANCCAN_25659 [Ancylostoma caninum]|uniref:Uncharacterized protein n=1 Tax=Ancylostoma caninum TaxID=29170 RepID=A0A368F8V7_ANCCA|nr:hypothetical protein ANCCAN_25659 [Ancylostoma caninum]
MEAGGEFWTLRIRKSKTDQESKGSSIYIGREERFDAALSRCSQRQIHGYVLATTEGRMWSPSAAASETGGATSSLDSGTDVNAVRRRGRWASLGSMEPYVKSSVKSHGGPTPVGM